MATAGARLAIRLLQDAAERGELDPWDVDVIAVVDGFLDQLRQRIEVPRLVAAMGHGGSYEQDLAETSEAFLAASMLVSLKAEVLEAQTFPQDVGLEEDFSYDFDAEGQGWLISPGVELPRRPERHLLRRPVAPPPLQRPATPRSPRSRRATTSSRRACSTSSRRCWPRRSPPSGSTRTSST